MKNISLLVIVAISMLVAHDGQAAKQEGNQFSCHCNCGNNSKVLISLMRSLLNQCVRKGQSPSGGTLPHGCPKAPKNCAEVLKCGGKQSGVYTIDPDGKGAFKVYCDQKTTGGGWTVFQKRKDGSVDFNQGWKKYQNGFGDLKGEFWLGLDKIYRLTHQARNRLRVEIEDSKGKSAYAEYSYFAVTSEQSKYKLSLGSYSGTAGDSLSYHKNQAFSTPDSDNDSSHGNCAAGYRAAWWYNSCYYSNLNGLYKYKGTTKGNGVNWRAWKNNFYSYVRAEMKVRPV